MSSELVKIEVVRAARWLDPQVLPAARRLVAQLDLIPMTSDLIESAADVGTDLLRSLDAIHLASAAAVAIRQLGWSASGAVCSTPPGNYESTST